MKEKLVRPDRQVKYVRIDGQEATDSKPVTILVVADTHARHISELSLELQAALHQATSIIHLGDYSSSSLLEEIRSLCPVYGVVGNHDEPSLHGALSTMVVIEVAGKRLGLIHGTIWPFGSHRRMRSWFKGTRIDALLYGHTHIPLSTRVGRTYFFNPGTAVGEFPGYRSSFGVLTIDGSISGTILPLPFFGRPHLPNRFRAAFVRAALRRIQAWPYVDLLGYISTIRDGIEWCTAGTAHLLSYARGKKLRA